MLALLLDPQAERQIVAELIGKHPPLNLFDRARLQFAKAEWPE